MDQVYKVAALSDNQKCIKIIKTGVEGAERVNPDRPISLMSLASRQGVDNAEERGLCYARFRADITLECEVMPDKGTIIGNDDVQLGILPEGKQCWPECTLFQNNRPCPLVNGVRYAWVETPGRLCLDDRLNVFKVGNSHTKA